LPRAGLYAFEILVDGMSAMRVPLTASALQPMSGKLH
jgi:hypothetical protein